MFGLLGKRQPAIYLYSTVRNSSETFCISGCVRLHRITTSLHFAQRPQACTIPYPSRCCLMRMSCMEDCADSGSSELIKRPKSRANLLRTFQALPNSGLCPPPSTVSAHPSPLTNLQFAFSYRRDSTPQRNTEH